MEKAALILRIREGQEEAYAAWAKNPPLAKLAPIWERNGIHQHTVFMSGRTVVAYYECESRYDVLKAFREPEALEMLLGELAPMLELDAYTPMPLYEEMSTWRREP